MVEKKNIQVNKLENASYARPGSLQRPKVKPPNFENSSSRLWNKTKSIVLIWSMLDLQLHMLL